MSAIVLLTVLHATVAGIQALLLLTIRCQILNAGQHCAGIHVEQVPVSAQMLLSILHLTVQIIIDRFLLIGNPLKTVFHVAVSVKQIPAAVNVLLTRSSFGSRLVKVLRISTDFEESDMNLAIVIEIIVVAVELDYALVGKRAGRFVNVVSVDRIFDVTMIVEQLKFLRWFVVCYLGGRHCTRIFVKMIQISVNFLHALQPMPGLFVIISRLLLT